jgi:protein-L-isoaspartate O-methyltransferase
VRVSHRIVCTYPFLVEPAWGTVLQGALWSVGFCAFAVLCSLVVLSLDKSNLQSPATAVPPPNDVANAEPPTIGRQWSWVLLPGFASVMLLATTNHVCQDVAVVPFLWVAPLSLYLVTFIICFDRESWYTRRWFSGLTLLAILGLHGALHFYRALPLVPEVGLCLLSMFLVCMICHGELVRSKPQPRFLTKFYLLTSAGGALGGICVAVICPLLFTTHYEMQLSFLIGVLLSAMVGVREFPAGFLARPQRKLVVGLAVLAMVLIVARVQKELGGRSAIVARRNFYGTLCVTKSETDSAMGTALIHGRILHGFQFDDPVARLEPTTYYSPRSGVGLALRSLRSGQPQRVGVVGLGCGTVATYGHDGDHFRFYEINPAIVEIAEKNFSFLKSSRAKIDVQLGDARLSLERELPHGFDVLILDAFSGDSIPAHLLTREAFAVYRRHIKPDGVIVVHVSNRHLRLEPVVLRQAEHLRMHCVQVATPGDRERALVTSKWMLMTSNEHFLSRPDVAAVAQAFGRRPGAEFPLWTDQYNNLFQILNAF